MKKLFLFFAAVMCAASMNAEIIQNDIPLDEATWNKGGSCTVSIDETGMHCTTTNMWGSVATDWEPSTDLSSWDKVVVVVTHMSGCAGEYFKLAVVLRDSDHPDDVEAQRGVLLGLDAVDDATNIIELDLTLPLQTCDVAKAHHLAIFCQQDDAQFTISRVYLERETEPDPEIDGFEQIVDSRESKVGSQKILRNGQILILRADKTYTIDGRIVH